jgi:hypothetical protein
MSADTLHLAQLIGPILILLGVSFGMNKKFYINWFKKMDKEDGFLFLAGLVETTAGLAIVLGHNLWGSAAEIIISFLGWAMILEGSLCLLLNKKFPKGIVSHMMKSMPEFMSISAVVMLVAGTYLSYLGYMM